MKNPHGVCAGLFLLFSFVSWQVAAATSNYQLPQRSTLIVVQAKVESFQGWIACPTPSTRKGGTSPNGDWVEQFIELKIGVIRLGIVFSENIHAKHEKPNLPWYSRFLYRGRGLDQIQFYLDIVDLKLSLSIIGKGFKPKSGKTKDEAQVLTFKWEGFKPLILIEGGRTYYSVAGSPDNGPLVSHPHKIDPWNISKKI